MENALPHLPSDIIINVLSRLPVKALMRFRCVSKSWHALVSDPNFIDTHRNQSCANDNGAVFAEYRSVDSGRDIFSLHCDETFVEQMELECPLSSRFYVVGTCHGVLCLSCHGAIYGDHQLYLWNPAIRKYKALPISFHKDFVHVAFGFVPHANDYKVLKLFHDDRNCPYFKVEIYSVRMNSWKRIPGVIPAHISAIFMDPVLNGFVHFGAITDYKFILTFDLANEVFGEIKIPDCCCDGSVLVSCITVLRESLYLFMDHKVDGNERLDVWVMKEYGVPESWTKQFTFDKGLRPFRLGIKNTGVILEGDDGELFSYDPRGQQVKHVQLHGDPKMLSAFTYYRESLVLLNDGD